MPNSKTPLSRFQGRFDAWQGRQRIVRIAYQVAANEKRLNHGTGRSPVVVFNASTRLTGLSQNAAFSLLTAWGLRLAGVPVVHFVCHSGLIPCVLGTNRDDYTAPPPCEPCIAESRRFYSGANVHWFHYREDPELAAALSGLGIEELANFEYPLRLPLRLRSGQGPGQALSTGVQQGANLAPLPFDSAQGKPFDSAQGRPFDSAQGRPIQLSDQVQSGTQSLKLPLGRLVLPSLRWALRRHTLHQAEATRFLFRQYILSAASIASEFADFIEQAMPEAAVIFNGMMYPEAVVRRVALAYGVRTITHEVGFQRFSAFFSEGDATAYPLDIPDSFELAPEQNSCLDAYLENRFQGKFTMAGIQFWPEMQRLDETFLQKASEYRQIVPVFTNVVYDTSQVHANTIFENMFEWLETVVRTSRAHPDTLFVIRAHPDEMRPGTRKQSRESVHDWIYANRVNELSNVVFIDSQEYASSYELIQRSKFVMVYNSSIGLEAALMGAAVLCGGKARYTQYPTVFFPSTKEEYGLQAEQFIKADTIEVPPEFERNARRFLYYQLYRASLPLDRYLNSAPRAGFVRLSPFDWRDLLPENSPTMKVILDGILDGKPFLMPDGER